MQHVDQHIDDLFRNAAENYQLKTTHDWDKIAPCLAGSATPPVTAFNRKNKKPWLIIAVLIPLSSLLLITLNKEKPVSEAQSAEVIVPAGQTIDPIQSPVKSFKQLSTNDPDQLTGSYIQQTQIKAPDLLKIGERQAKPFFPEEADKTNNAENTSTKTDPGAAHTAIDMDQPVTEVSAKRRPVQTENSTISLEFQTPTKINNKVRLGPDTDQNPTAFIPVKKSPEIRGLYLGLSAGPQWNQVEGQGYNKTGFNLGLIAGFSFSKKLATESGIFYSKKYYYSDGKYFHMKKNPGTPSMEVISLEGSSNVVEIPIKIKYDLIDKKKGELFITAGLSTYILTKENNQYYALINGTPQNSTVSYEKRKTYLAGGMNLSAGYSIHLKKKTDIRIEPYLQIPFKGTGVGSMRVTTTGLNIGISRNLHK
jgi:Outer membrane protein beta-barrel domain